MKMNKNTKKIKKGLSKKTMFQKKRERESLNTQKREEQKRERDFGAPKINVSL